MLTVDKKITILLRDMGKSGGPSIFRHRLFDALPYVPNTQVISDKSHKYHVELAFINIPPKKSKPIVVRIDGCYYMTKHLKMNNGVLDAVKRADHVIFQSYFSKKMCQLILGHVPTNSSVIYNGINLTHVNFIKKNTNMHEDSFVCCANWRHNKRLKSIIHGFIKADIPNNLYIIGDKTYFYLEHPRIHWLGNLETDEILSVMKSCKYLIHLCHIDSCPNVVVEGLSCGLSVLCTNLGGTPEIVKDRGVILNVDNWDFSPGDFKDLDNLDASVVADGIHELINKKIAVVDNVDFDIKSMCQKYVDVCRSVV